MNIYVSLIGITIIAVLTYFAVMRILEMVLVKKRKRLSSFLDEDKGEKNSTLMKFLDKMGIREYLNPNHIIMESKKYGEPITKRSFIITFLMGTLIGVVVMVVYFQPVIFLMPVSFIGGIIATNVRLHNIKKRYLQELDSKLAVYMSSLTTAMGTFTNLKDALKSIIPSLDYPIKNDVEEALVILQDGKSVKEAFAKMNNSYSQKQVKLFHDQLDVIVKSGISNVESLRSVAFKMKRKEVYRRKLQTAHRSQFKVWKAFVFLSLSAPFLFIFVSMDNYKLVMNHIAASVVFALTFISIFFTYRQLEKLEVYDPTADESIEI
ncbi:hypothetical protein G3M81_22945 [Bacillus paralicheniformis]|jgi:tight adherence protein B|uniref:type II secretion system F family protein n=1 Tax=Bacillus TaxID=1386 RepID=UPI0013EEB221|nr:MULTISPECIES: hypothetical protein [Bacillus]QII26949.1 hypothetical protein G3M80_20855 [Bacillus altitudinis]QII51417.1 hypothetical protein G3M81_22945 [Bacillus paralicheniformis]